MLKQGKIYDAQMIEKYRKIASGDLSDVRKNYPEIGPPNRYGSLKSVSNEASRFMERRRSEEEWAKRAIQDAVDALAEYDKSGFLRHLGEVFW